jgi:signal transduction histidine kinase
MTAAACVIVAAAIVVGAGVLLIELRRTLISNVDDEARTRANDVVELIRADELPVVLAAPGEDLVQVVDGRGTVIASSANLEGAPPIAGFRPRGRRAEVRSVRDIPGLDDDRYRVVALPASTAGGPVTVYVAANVEQAEESVAAIRRLLVVGLPAVLALVAAASWFIIGRALRPVEAIRAEVADISAHDLGRRVPEPGNDDEIDRLARTMNQMLDRLEAFTDRQRRFVADASHELQSPLASSLAALEVARRHPEATDWPATAADLLADNDRMTRLVRDLLFLARADDPTVADVRSAVDLDDIVRDEVIRLRARTSITVDSSGVAPVEVRANRDQLARVVRNLLENAQRYARSKIRIDVNRNGADAVMIVADDGPGVPESARDLIFERFVRVDDSRSRDTGGAGLGLAIAREIVESHGGSIVLAPDGRGARFVVRLPTSP